LEDKVLDERIILKWMFKNLDGGVDRFRRGLGQREKPAPGESGKRLGSINCGEFLE